MNRGENIRLFLGVFLLTLVIAVLVVAFVTGWFGLSEYLSCQQLGEADPDHNYEWGFWMGCTIETQHGYRMAPDGGRLLEFGE